MKKNLLSLICFLACVTFVHAQTLFGVTPKGGNDGAGTIIKFIPATNNLTVAKSFENYAKYPLSNFIQASNGKLYGTASRGGNDNIYAADHGGGVIISFDPSTSTYTKLKNFDGTDGATPYGGLVQASDGKLYGMTNNGGSNWHVGNTYGVIFSFDPSNSAYTKLKDFDSTNGANPTVSLIQASDGKLYGVTPAGGSNGIGVIFSFDPSSSTYTKLKDFDGTDGRPGSLILANDGKLYGTTSSGGGNNVGIIFSFDPSSSTFTKLKDFEASFGYGPGGLMQASDGKFYGTSGGGSGASGIIFSFDPSSSILTKLKDFEPIDGVGPFGLMQASDGKLYGIAGSGGSTTHGVIFSFVTSTSTFTKLKDFEPTNDGSSPIGIMQAGNGKLYGMTTRGGSGGIGAIFSFDPSSSTLAKLKDFEATNGRDPSASLMQAGNGKLYGMTARGGSTGLGAIFSFDPSSSTLTKLKDFDGTDGAYPYGSLMQASNGKLYGMTLTSGLWGVDGKGVIFSFEPSTSIYAKLMDFDGANGYYPRGNLIQAGDGKLYGITAAGGSNGSGVIFSFDFSTSTYTKVKNFDGTDGAGPNSGLLQASNGKLYGMTVGGGSNGSGVIFSFDPSTSIYTKLKDFDGINGAGPQGNLMQAGDGKLYGMTYSGGSNGDGVIFSFDPSSSTYTKLWDFDGTNGANPPGNLLQASDGKLYGMTDNGGTGRFGGVIFSFDPSSSTYTKLKDVDGSNNGFSPSWGSGFIELLNSGGGIKPALSITITSGSYPSCPGQSITFTARPTNGGNSPLYQWKVNGNNVGTNSSTFTTTTLTNGQVVSCVMTSNAPNANPAAATSNTVTMAVNAVVIPTIVITQTICGSDSVSFSSTVTNGGSAPAFLWTYTGTGTATYNTGSYFSLQTFSNGAQVQCRLISNASCVNPVQVISTPLTINCVTTGVSNIDDLEEFKIMPNPNNGLFTVKIKLHNQREVRFTLFNSLGRPVYQSPLTRMIGTQTKQISVSSLPGAIYFLKTEIGNQVTYERIIIIKN